MLLCVVLFHGMPAIASPIEVLLIGDSITEGCVSGPTGTDCTCDQGLCYASKLSTHLGSDYQIVNGGVGGSTTADWASETVGIPYVVVDDTPTPIFEGVAVPNPAVSRTGDEASPTPLSPSTRYAPSVFANRVVPVLSLIGLFAVPLFGILPLSSVIYCPLIHRAATSSLFALPLWRLARLDDRADLGFK